MAGGLWSIGISRPQWQTRDQLAAILRSRIASGEITSRLPGERALQQEFGLAPVTVRKAVRQLRDEGLVRATPGWGTYVVKKGDNTCSWKSRRV